MSFSAPIQRDTIVAIATAPQTGAIGILRLSGPESVAVLSRIFFKPDGGAFARFRPRYFHFGKIHSRDGSVLDEALAVWMKAPHSFTGEDVVEIHAHGNVILLKRILSAILSYSDTFSIRAAEAGEFTRRAYLNARMDLTRAEAVHEIITAESEASLDASLANLDGALARRVAALRDELKVALALVEASFEFPEEDIQTFDRDEVWELLKRARENLQTLSQAYATSKLYDSGVSVALIGRPNVGKSSLLNAILVEDRAIVTDIAGTTRDVVEGVKLLSGIRFIFRDTAGLRETSDVVESAGIARSQALIEKSDVILWISDDPRDSALAVLGMDLSQKPVLRVLNKLDLLQKSVSASEYKSFDFLTSAATRQGLDGLESALVAFVHKKVSTQNVVHVNQRQYNALQSGLEIILRLLENNAKFEFQEEILAAELRQVVGFLEEITGELSSDEVLGEIFRRFCIGK